MPNICNLHWPIQNLPIFQKGLRFCYIGQLFSQSVEDDQILSMLVLLHNIEKLSRHWGYPCPSNTHCKRIYVFPLAILKNKIDYNVVCFL